MKRVEDEKVLVENSINLEGTQIITKSKSLIDRLNMNTSKIEDQLKLNNELKEKLEYFIKKELQYSNEKIRNSELFLKNSQLIENLNKKQAKINELEENLKVYKYQIKTLKNQFKLKDPILENREEKIENEKEESDIEEKFDHVFYNEVKGYTTEDWKNIARIAKKNNASSLAVPVFNSISNDIENKKFNRERIEWGMRFLEELKKKKINYLEIKSETKNFEEKNMNIKKIKDVETILSKVKDVKNYQAKDWLKLMNFDRRYKIFSSKEIQIVNNIITRIKLGISTSEDGLSMVEQCVSKAINNGFELYILDMDGWSVFIEYSKNKNLFKPVDMNFLESTLRHLTKYKNLKKNQLMKSNELFKEFKEKTIAKEKDVSFHNKNKKDEFKEIPKTNDKINAEEKIIEEMQALSYTEWDDAYKWAKKEKILNSEDLKLLNGVARSRFSGNLSINSLKSTLGVYYLLKKSGFTCNPVVDYAKSLSSSKQILSKREGFNFSRLEGITLSKKEAIAKEYLTKLEGKIMNQYTNNITIGRILKKSIFEVKKDLNDFNLIWNSGKGYRNEDILNNFKKVLESAIRKSTDKKIGTKDKVRTKEFGYKEEPKVLSDNVPDELKDILL